MKAMPKPTANAKISELEKRIEHLENFARAAIAFYKLLQAFANKETTTT